jgi:hypothetical protein
MYLDSLFEDLIVVLGLNLWGAEYDKIVSESAYTIDELTDLIIRADSMTPEGIDKDFRSKIRGTVAKFFHLSLERSARESTTN